MGKNSFREIEQALKEEQDYVAAINNTIGSLVIVLDREGRIIRFNRTCELITGYLFTEAVNRFYWDLLLQEEERELAKSYFLNLQPDHFPYELENTWVMKDGSTRQILCSNAALLDEDGKIRYHIGTGIDVTERNNAEKKLRETNEKLRALIHASPLAVISLSLQGLVKSWSSAAEKIFGWSEREVLNSLLPIFTMAEESFSVLLDNVSRGKYFNNKEFKCHRKNGAAVYVSLSAAPLRSYNGSINGIMIIADDITERRQAEEQLRYLSFHDSLTGLYNRAFFEEELKRLNTARQLPLSIVIGDVNGLKLINDTFGHGEGDKYLQSIAVILKESCRQEDVICRWGGDEFALLLPKTDQKIAAGICERIKQACNHSEEHLFPLSISLGMITKNNEVEDIFEKLKKAEDRMYSNKVLDSKNACTSVIGALQTALSENTRETEEHILKIQSNALLLGYALELSIDELDCLTILSPMHDIGMIALPPEVVNKEGIFTRKEREIMKQHSEIGYRIARAVPELSHIADIILSHHERWDGKGYPRGLQGEDIPLVARIFAVAESFEAITSGRSYQKAGSKSAALAELQKNAGRQFDPKIVKKFAELF